MGEQFTRGAIGVALFLWALAAISLGLAAAFAAIYMRLAASLPPAGATLLAAVLLCVGVTIFAFLVRWLKPAKIRAGTSSRLPPRELVRDGFGPAFVASAIPPPTPVPFGVGFMGDLHDDSDHPPRPRKRRPLPGKTRTAPEFSNG